MKDLPDDPGPKVQALAKAATEAAGEAGTLLKRGDVAHAAKAAEKAGTMVRQASELVTAYGKGIDDAAATQKPQSTNTPWGSITLPPEPPSEIVSLLIPLGGIYTEEKSGKSAYQAAYDQLSKAVPPLMPYLKAPDKASAEILKCASKQAVTFAEESDTAGQVKEFAKICKNVILVLIKNAEGQLESAQGQLKALNLRDQADEKREAAEKASGIIDIVVDVLADAGSLAKKGAELAEEGPLIAVSLAGDLIKLWAKNNLLEKAKELENEAKVVAIGAIVKAIQTAQDALGGLGEQIGELSLMQAGSAAGAKRKVNRAVEQYDADCDKHGDKIWQFRFRLVAVVQKVADDAQETADYQYRLWLGAEVNRASMEKLLDKLDYWWGNNRKTIDGARRDIQIHVTEYQLQQKKISDIRDRLDKLYASASKALTNAPGH
jgi:hypothetical protein